MKAVLPVLRFLRERQVRGERCALVTLTNVSGSAIRAPGEHMAVAESGASMGSFSGGCIEAAVIAEARDALVAGRARLVRFGAGSRYIDIRLPCGGGIDLLFTLKPDLQQLDRAIAALEARTPILLELNERGLFKADEAKCLNTTGWTNDTFQVRHDPSLHLVVLGQGAEPMALHDLAVAYGAGITLLSPQADLIEEARLRGAAAHRLQVLGRSEHIVADRWTAVVALFHDHDWETALLLQAIEQTPLFVGAMGSRRTHEERCRRLLEAGGDPQAVSRIIGPIGILAASRDPHTLALSIMAQVAATYDVSVSHGASSFVAG